MRLITIWTLPVMSFPDRVKATTERFYMQVARMLPRRVKYWVVLFGIADATKDVHDIMATTVDDVLYNLDHHRTQTKG